MIHPNLLNDLINYYNVDLDTGLWESAEDAEHPSTAAPKVIHNLTHRIQRIYSNLAESIKSTITKIHDLSATQILFQETIEDTRKELDTDLKMLEIFTDKIVAFIKSEEEMLSKGQASPRVKLNKISSVSKLTSFNGNTLPGSPNLLLSPFSSSRNIISGHERLENQEILRQLKSTSASLQKLQSLLPIIELCWSQMVQLDGENNPEALSLNLRKIQNHLIPLQSSEASKEIYEAFFHIDDASVGLLHIQDPFSIEIDGSEVVLKLIKVIHRTLLKSPTNYQESDEKVLIDRAFEQIGIYNTKNFRSEHIQALKEVPFYLEIEPAAHPSPELCFRKLGELHANIRQKRLELTGLSYLQKYFPKPLADLSNRAMAELAALHKQFIKAHPKPKERTQINRASPAEENLHELEITAQLLQNTLLSTEPGEKFFTISNKLREVNHHIAGKYAVLMPEVQKNCIEILGSELFTNFVVTLTELMLELREEQLEHGEISVEPDDLQAVGNATGKTTMIDNYKTAIEEILAPLSTFMGNSLHHLLQEMLRNTRPIDWEARQNLIRAYRATSKALEELEGEILSNSKILAKN